MTRRLISRDRDGHVQFAMVDAAHFIGLVAGKVVDNPTKYADVVTATTHKALRGPRGGIILTREEFAKDIEGMR